MWCKFFVLFLVLKKKWEIRDPALIYSGWIPFWKHLTSPWTSPSPFGRFSLNLVWQMFIFINGTVDLLVLRTAIWSCFKFLCVLSCYLFFFMSSLLIGSPISSLCGELATTHLFPGPICHSNPLPSSGICSDGVCHKVGEVSSNIHTVPYTFEDSF